MLRGLAAAAATSEMGFSTAPMRVARAAITAGVALSDLLAPESHFRASSAPISIPFSTLSRMFAINPLSDRAGALVRRPGRVRAQHPGGRPEGAGQGSAALSNGAQKGTRGPTSFALRTRRVCPETGAAQLAFLRLIFMVAKPGR